MKQIKYIVPMLMLIMVLFGEQIINASWVFFATFGYFMAMFGATWFMYRAGLFISESDYE